MKLILKPKVTAIEVEQLERLLTNSLILLALSYIYKSEMFDGWTLAVQKTASFTSSSRLFILAAASLKLAVSSLTSYKLNC